MCIIVPVLVPVFFPIISHDSANILMGVQFFNCNFVLFIPKIRNFCCFNYILNLFTDYLFPVLSSYIYAFIEKSSKAATILRIWAYGSRFFSHNGDSTFCSMQFIITKSKYFEISTMYVIILNRIDFNLECYVFNKVR